MVRIAGVKYNSGRPKGMGGTGHTVDYGIKPKKLDFACEHCEKRYTYVFKILTRDEWNKELSEIKCPHCKKKRI